MSIGEPRPKGQRDETKRSMSLDWRSKESRGKRRPAYDSLHMLAFDVPDIYKRFGVSSVERDVLKLNSFYSDNSLSKTSAEGVI